MPTTKQKIKDSLDALPDNATLEDILYHIEFIARLERGLEQSENRELIPHDEVGKLIKEW